MDDYDSIVSRLPASNFISSRPLSTLSNSDGVDDVDADGDKCSNGFPISRHPLCAKIAYITTLNPVSVYKYDANLTITDNEAQGG